MGTGLVSASFWNGRRVFVTGHTGFKGSWLVAWLHSLGAVVRGYSLPPVTTPNMFELAGIARLCQHVEADIRDAAALAAAISDFQPETVFHMAAQPLVRRSYREPLLTMETNIMGTANLLNACRGSKAVSAVVVVTTDKCYENDDSVHRFKEDDRLGGADPYSASKACAELVTTSFRHSYFDQGPVIATARAGNVIGGGDWSEDRIVPDGIRAFSAGQPLLIRSPKAVRDWQHVIDVLAGYLLLAQACTEQGAEYGRGWNFGPDASATVEQLVELLAKGWGGSATYTISNRDAGAAEAVRLELDAALARSRLGWSTRMDLSLNVDATIEWYRAALDRHVPADRLLALTCRQIGRFSPTHH
jgi:CDP-glucose 4,6-dehydratase